MTEKLFLKSGTAYITNVCNLTCEYCVSYNNFKFTGHYKWNDYKDMFVEWSKKIEIGEIGIIGGEPFSNPDYLSWAIGLRELWPKATDFSISTNGTIMKNKIEEIREMIRHRIWIDICVHDPAHYKDIEEDLILVLSAFSNVTKSVRSDGSIDYYLGNNLIAKLYATYSFVNNSIKNIKNKIIYMHNSDPVKAHGSCGLCHYFVRGNLFKCPLTAIADDLVEQFSFESSARSLLTSYRSCSPYDDDQFIRGFLETIEMPISQCALCPEKHSVKPIWPLSPKKKDL